MAIDRTTILRGPGYMTYASASIQSIKDIVATLVEEWSDSLTSGYGRIGRTLKNRHVEVSAQPSTWANLAALLPYAALQMGDAIYGADDVPLVITPRNGDVLTVNNVAISTLANLAFSADADLFASDLKWTGLVGNNCDPSLLSSYFTFAGAPATNVTQLGANPALMFRGRYSAVRNDVTLRGDKGFGLTFALALDDDQPDGEVTVNKRLKSLDAAIKCIPVGLTEAGYLALLNDGVDVGGNPAAYDLVVSGPAPGYPVFTLANTYVEPGSYVYGSSNASRTGELTLQSIRKITTNALAALWTVGTVPEPS